MCIRAGSQALPGLAAAALGASKVVVSDSGDDIIRLLEENVKVGVSPLWLLLFVLFVANLILHALELCSQALTKKKSFNHVSIQSINRPSTRSSFLPFLLPSNNKRIENQIVELKL